MASESSSRGTTRSRKRTNKEAKVEQSLFKDVVQVQMGDTRTIPRLVQTWIESYTKDDSRFAARAELYNFILEACGVDLYMIDQYDINISMWYPLTNISVMYYDVDEAEVDMTRLITLNAVRDFPNLKNNMKVFWDCFVKQSQNEILFFDILEECMKYHITFSCHLPKGYKEMPILMALQTLSSLVFVTKSQLDGGLMNGKHIRALERQIIKYFQGIFLRNHKDEDDEVKSSCLEELREWIKTYPNIFSMPAYTKFLQD